MAFDENGLLVNDLKCHQVVCQLLNRCFNPGLLTTQDFQNLLLASPNHSQRLFSFDHLLSKGKTCSGVTQSVLIPPTPTPSPGPITFQTLHGSQKGLDSDSPTWAGPFFSVYFSLPEVGLRSLERKETARPAHSIGYLWVSETHPRFC